MLYHYTASNALINILETRTLWASDVRFLNDSSELAYASSMIRSMVSQESVDQKQTSPNGQEEFFEARKSSLLEQIDKYYPNGSLAQTFHEDQAYVVSMTTDRDNLDLWRGYSAFGGFNIGFDEDIVLRSFEVGNLQRILTEVPNIASGERVSNNIDLFDLTFNEAIDLANKNCYIQVEALPVTYGESGLEEKIALLLEQADPNGYTMLSKVFASVKHPAFQSEQEVRLLITPAGDFSPTCLLRVGPTNLVPYLQFGFPYEAIREITVGPSRYQDRQVAALRHYLSDGLRGQWGHVKVNSSVIPLIE